MVQTAENLKRGNGIIIEFDGTRTTLTADNGGADQTFSSLEGLKDAVNNFVPGLAATIKDGRIFIAADDTASAAAANGTITFADANAGNLVSTLGLIDVAAVTDAGVQRFATLKTLQKRVNLNNTNTGHKADFKNGANLDLHSLIASSNLQLGGRSANGPYSFSRARIGTSYAGDTERMARATYTVEAPKHGLRPGDFVQMARLRDGRFNDGRYMVTRVSADSFSVASTNPDVGLLGVNFPLAGVSLNGVAGTWQKIAGEVITRNDTPIGIIPPAPGAGATVTFTLPPYAAGEYLVGEAVYISGIGGAHIGLDNFDIPDGYYTLTALNQVAGTITITVNPNNRAAGAPADANHPAINPADVRVQKVGGAPIGGFQSNPRVMTTNRAVDGVPVNTVRLFLPHTNYNIGDYFKMTGLPNAGVPLVIDGMTITQGDDYQITNKDPAGNWIEFQPPLAAGGAPAGNVNSLYGVANLQDVGNDFRIDNYALTSKYLGLQSQVAKVFGATYSQTDPLLSISNIDPKTSKHVGKIFNTAVKVGECSPKDR